jgi:hypothetical protein
MRSLPTEVQRTLRSARDGRASLLTQRTHLDDAQRVFAVYVGHFTIWSDSLDECLERRGMEYVDRNDEAQCRAFLARVGQDALSKRYKLTTAIAAAKCELQRLEQALARCCGN